MWILKTPNPTVLFIEIFLHQALRFDQLSRRFCNAISKTINFLQWGVTHYYKELEPLHCQNVKCASVANVGKVKKTLEGPPRELSITPH